MKHRMYAAVFVMLALVAMPLVAQAVKSDNLSIELTARKIVKDEKGAEKSVPAEVAKPGDTIEYTAVYKNAGKAVAKNVLGTLPVPQGMEYVPGSAKPDKFAASLDGKKFSPAPLKRKVRLPNGKEELRDVPAKEYRALRWDLKDMAPGASAKVSARVRITSAGDVLIQNKQEK